MTDENKKVDDVTEPSRDAIVEDAGIGGRAA